MVGPVLSAAVSFPEWAGLDSGAVLCNLARAGEPDAILVLVLDAVLNRFAQRTQPEWLTDDEAMQRRAEDQRLLSDCSSISSNWSTIMSANSRPV